MGDRQAGAVSYLVVHKELGQHEEEAKGIHPWGDKTWLRPCMDYAILTAPELYVHGFLAGSDFREQHPFLQSP